METGETIAKERRGREVILAKTEHSDQFLCFFEDCIRRLSLADFADCVLWSLQKDSVLKAQLSNGATILYYYRIKREVDFPQGKHRVIHTVEVIYYCVLKANEIADNYLIYDREKYSKNPMVEFRSTINGHGVSDERETSCLPSTTSWTQIIQLEDPIENKVIAQIEEHEEQAKKAV